MARQLHHACSILFSYPKWWHQLQPPCVFAFIFYAHIFHFLFGHCRCTHTQPFVRAPNMFYALLLSISFSYGRPPLRTLNPTLTISQSLRFGRLLISLLSHTTTFPHHIFYIVWHKPWPTLAISSSTSTFANRPCVRFLIPLIATSIPPSCPNADTARKARQTSSTLRTIHAHKTQLFRVAIGSRPNSTQLQHIVGAGIDLAAASFALTARSAPIRTVNSNPAPAFGITALTQYACRTYPKPYARQLSQQSKPWYVYTQPAQPHAARPTSSQRFVCLGTNKNLCFADAPLHAPSFRPLHEKLLSCRQCCRTPVRLCVRCTNFIKLFSLHFVRHFDILSLIAVSVFLSSCTYLRRQRARPSLVYKCTARTPHTARSPLDSTWQCLQPLGARQRPAYFIHCCTFFPFLLCVSHSSTSHTGRLIVNFLLRPSHSVSMLWSP